MGQRSGSRGGGRRGTADPGRRRLLRLALPLLAGLLLAASLLDREIGVGRWWSLAGDLGRAEQRIERLRAEIRDLEVESRALREDDFAIERAIREDLELALPGEIVVRSAPEQRELALAP